MISFLKLLSGYKSSSKNPGNLNMKVPGTRIDIFPQKTQKGLKIAAAIVAVHQTRARVGGGGALRAV